MKKLFFLLFFIFPSQIFCMDTRLQTRTPASLKELTISAICDNFHRYPESSLDSIPEPLSSEIRKKVDDTYNVHVKFLKKRFNFFAQSTPDSSSVITIDKSPSLDTSNNRIISNNDLSLLCFLKPNTKKVLIWEKQASNNTFAKRSIALPFCSDFMIEISRKNHLLFSDSCTGLKLAIIDLAKEDSAPLLQTENAENGFFSRTGRFIALMKKFYIFEDYNSTDKYPLKSTIHRIVLKEFNDQRQKYETFAKSNFTNHTITSLAWSKDEQFLAKGKGKGIVSIYKVGRNKLIPHQIYTSKNRSPVSRLRFSPDHNYLAISYNNGTVALVNIKLNQCVKTVAPINTSLRQGSKILSCKTSVSQMAFDPTSKILFANCTIKAWISGILSDLSDFAEEEKIIIIPVNKQQRETTITTRSSFTSKTEPIVISRCITSNQTTYHPTHYNETKIHNRNFSDQLIFSHQFLENPNKKTQFIFTMNNFEKLPLSAICALFTITEHPENATLETWEILKNNGFEKEKLKLSPEEMKTIKSNSRALNETNPVSSLSAEEIAPSRIKHAPKANPASSLFAAGIAASQIKHTPRIPVLTHMLKKQFIQKRSAGSPEALD